MDYICLFFRAPEPGKVLSGLSSILGPEKCLQLYQAMIDDALEFTQELGIKRMIACYPNAEHPYFQAMAKRIYIEMASAPGNTEGECIGAGLNACITKGAQRALYWDGYAPTLGPKNFKECFMRLDKADLILGPALNYRTYIIGIKKKVPDFLQKVQWDSPKEFPQLVEFAEAAKIETNIQNVHPRLRHSDDLPYFVMHLRQLAKTNVRIARHTRKTLEAFKVL